MSRNKASSQRWLDRQRKDAFVKQAQKGGWRSRAVFKLEQIDKRDRLIRPGMVIVDIGAAPGGWSQYAARKLKGTGHVVAMDILPIDPLPQVDILQGDLRDDAVVDELARRLDGRRVDLVLCDIAPNMSGVAVADIARAYELAEMAADFALQHLRAGGDFLVKVFNGDGFEEYRHGLREHFARVGVRKPEASRAESREVYLLAQGRKQAHNETPNGQ